MWMRGRWEGSSRRKEEQSRRGEEQRVKCAKKEGVGVGGEGGRRR